MPDTSSGMHQAQGRPDRALQNHSAPINVR
jgi:hypothetical protein